VRRGRARLRRLLRRRDHDLPHADARGQRAHQRHGRGGAATGGAHLRPGRRGALGRGPRPPLRDARAERRPLHRGEPGPAEDGAVADGTVRGALAPAPGADDARERGQAGGHPEALRPRGRRGAGGGVHPVTGAPAVLGALGLGSVSGLPWGRAVAGGREVAVVLQDDGSVTSVAGEPLDEGRLTWLPPVDARTVIAIALNYRDHAAELDLAQPDQPALFPKFANAMVGHRQPVVRPRGIRFMHYETELAVVMGRPARRVRAEDALAHVAGYTIANDLVVRDFVIDHFRPPIKPKNF